MQLLHPFTPFISEEIYHLLKERKEGDDLTVKQLAQGSFQPEILAKGKILTLESSEIEMTTEYFKIFVRFGTKNKLGFEE